MEDSDVKKLFGRKIKEYRKKNNLTQARLAELTNVDDKHISCIESGRNFPSPELLFRLAQSLNVEMKDLFEFYHLQDKDDLISDISKMLKKLDYGNLSLAYKFIRTFLI